MPAFHAVVLVTLAYAVLKNETSMVRLGWEVIVLETTEGLTRAGSARKATISTNAWSGQQTVLTLA